MLRRFGGVAVRVGVGVFIAGVEASLVVVTGAFYLFRFRVFFVFSSDVGYRVGFF